MEYWAEIRWLHNAENVPIKEIARRLGIARNTVRAALIATEPLRSRWLCVNPLALTSGQAAAKEKFRCRSLPGVGNASPAIAERHLHGGVHHRCGHFLRPLER